MTYRWKGNWPQKNTKLVSLSHLNLNPSYGDVPFLTFCMTLTLIFDLSHKFYFCNFITDSAHILCNVDQKHNKIKVIGSKRIY